MFKRKILASALIGSLVFSLFPTNISFANNLTEAERKICENKDNILYFDVNGNDLFVLFDDKNTEDIDNEEELSKLKPSYMTKNGEKIGENYLSDLRIGSWNGEDSWFPVTTVVNGDFYDYSSFYPISNFIKNGKKIDLNFDDYGPYSKIKVNEKGDFIYEGRDAGNFYKNGVKIDFPEKSYPSINKFGNIIYDLNDKYYSNNIELNIPENAEIIYETVQDGNFIYELNEKYYNKNNTELKVGKEIDNIKGKSWYNNLKQNHILNGNDLYIQKVDKVDKEKGEYDKIYSKSFKIYKNGNIILENNFKEEFYISRNILKINNNGDIYSFLGGSKIYKDGIIYKNGKPHGIIYKNGKPLCEKTETQPVQTPANPGNQNSTTNQGSSNSGDKKDFGSAPSESVVSKITPTKDGRVFTGNKTENLKKDEKKIPQNNLNNSLNETEKTTIKKTIGSIFEKYSNNKSFLEKINKALTSREDILKMAENNPRIKFIIEEFKQEFLKLLIKNNFFSK